MTGKLERALSLAWKIEMEGSKSRSGVFSKVFICLSLFLLAWVLRGCYSDTTNQEELQNKTERLVEVKNDSAPVTSTEAPKQPDFWKATFDTVGVVAEQAPKFLLLIGNAFLNHSQNQTEEAADSLIYSVVKKQPLK